MKRMVLLLSLSFMACVTMVVLLVGFSDSLKKNRSSFLRLFPSHPVEELASFDLGHNGYYIAGTTSQWIYLGNYEYPLHVLAVSMALKDSCHIRLSIDGVRDQKFWSLKIKIDSPNFYAYDGVLPRIYGGRMDDWRATDLGVGEEFFQDVEPVSAHLFALRSLDTLGINMLGLASIDSPKYRFVPGLLKKQVDGNFCTDGMLEYNRERGRLYYVYRYRNQILELDTSLGLVNLGRTIDTISFAQIKLAKTGNGAVTFSAPPLSVNKRIAMSGDLMLVNSALEARNEPVGAHKGVEVIDVYALSSLQYMFSFYLHQAGSKERLRQFTTRDGYLLVLYDAHLELHKLRSQFFDKNESLFFE